MNDGLYPLKFQTQYKERIWGGRKLESVLHKAIPSDISNCGESWEISAVQDSVSVVSNGFLAGNDLQELIEVYMGELVGDSIYEKFGDEFPLLIKLIDAQDVLSIQVHPDDDTAQRVHHAYGKTEMWYVIDAEDDSYIITGFNREVTREEYLACLSNKSLKSILNIEATKPGDIFYIPSGRVHAIGKGVLLAEIQQTSDITYRIYDWDRVDANKRPRELHTDLAIDVIDFSEAKDSKWTKPDVENRTAELVKCNYFTVNRITLTETVHRDYDLLDSFVVYLCLDGQMEIEYTQGRYETIAMGETVLIPACFSHIVLRPASSCTVLEIYVENV
ncbi:MAG: class I mannose-6-phosphate isomerase [Bacteroidales bacterium]|nr:class I mannose-6-phosphate isomerase [Bacteroidales bacterium]